MASERGAAAFRLLRESAGLSREALASLLGSADEATVGRWEDPGSPTAAPEEAWAALFRLEDCIRGVVDDAMTAPGLGSGMRERVAYYLSQEPLDQAGISLPYPCANEASRRIRAELASEGFSVGVVYVERAADVPERPGRPCLLPRRLTGAAERAISDPAACEGSFECLGALFVGDPNRSRREEGGRLVPARAGTWRWRVSRDADGTRACAWAGERPEAAAFERLGTATVESGAAGVFPEMPKPGPVALDGPCAGGFAALAGPGAMDVLGVVEGGALSAVVIAPKGSEL